jgi:hypothetical protein
LAAQDPRQCVLSLEEINTRCATAFFAGITIVGYRPLSGPDIFIGS